MTWENFAAACCADMVSVVVFGGWVRLRVLGQCAMIFVAFFYFVYWYGIDAARSSVAIFQVNGESEIA